MGWGLILNGVFLSRVTKAALPNALSETSEEIKYLENFLIALVSYTDKTYMHEDVPWALPEYAIMKVPQILEELGDLYQKRMLIQYAIDNPEEIIED